MYKKIFNLVFFVLIHHLSGEEVLVNGCRGIVLISNHPRFLNQNYNEVKGLLVQDVNLPGPIEKLNQRLEPIYKDRSMTWTDLNSLKKIIASFYEEYHKPLVQIHIPDQEVTEGVIKICIASSRLGEIHVEGNRWSKPDRLRGYVQLKPGDCIDQKVLLEDLNFMNQNPFRNVDLVYAPGENEATTDIILVSNERRSSRVYAGADNTGVESTETERWFTGFNLGNVFNSDQILSFQYSSAWNLKRFQAYTGQYQIPLPWHHILSLYGGYSTVEPDLKVPGMKNKGNSAQASLRYFISCYLSVDHRAEWRLGGDYKRTNNTFEFEEMFGRFGRNVNLTQFVFGYSGNYIGNRFSFHYEADTFISPGRWLPNQKNSNYSSLRQGARNQWFILRGDLSYSQKIPKDFLLFLDFRGQVTTQNLLPMEQIGIGGYNTVRGYEERELNFDNGLITNLELRSPYIPVFQHLWRQVYDGAQFLVFFDYGWGSNHDKTEGLDNVGYLMGVGPGFRYTFDPYITLRCDWGIKLHRKPEFGGGDSRIHFSCIASY